jgi:hypothetical protein
VRTWVERGDPAVRGRVIDVATGGGAAVRGVEPLLALLARMLAEFEQGETGATPL